MKIEAVLIFSMQDGVNLEIEAISIDTSFSL